MLVTPCNASFSQNSLVQDTVKSPPPRYETLNATNQVSYLATMLGYESDSHLTFPSQSGREVTGYP